MAKLTLGERINAFFLKMLSKFFLNYKQDLNPLDFKKGIIFCQMGIGNCILFLPVIKNLLIRRPDLELVILTNKKVIYEILNDQFQKPRIILADLRNYSFLKKINFYYKMRKEKFDFSIMNFLGQSKENIQLHLIAGIPFRIGHTLKDSGGRGKYDFLFNYPLSIQGKHEL
ncbi:MAG: hypothetical protein K9H65_04990, partial [Bacteroidales bacterium]|nr:hypothetical protein [Bacteroidales bacterium]